MSKLNLSSPEPEKNDVDSQINDFLGNYSNASVIKDDDDEDEPEEKPEPKQQEKVTETQDPVIDGLVMITLIDMVLPSLMILGYKKFAKKKVSIPASKLQLTKKQLKDLSPIADEVSKKINFGNTNPVTLLIISMGSMYFANMMSVLHDLETT